MQRWNACWLLWQLVGAAFNWAHFTALTNTERQWLKSNVLYIAFITPSLLEHFHWDDVRPAVTALPQRWHRLRSNQPYRMLLSRSVMADKNYFCACLKQRVNILMNVTIDGPPPAPLSLCSLLLSFILSFFPASPPLQAASLWARSLAYWSRKPCSCWRRSVEVFKRCSRTTTKSLEVVRPLVCVDFHCCYQIRNARINEKQKHTQEFWNKGVKYNQKIILIITNIHFSQLPKP